MKAHKFVAVHGIEKAKAVLEGAPEWANFWISRDQYHGHIISFPNMTGHYSVHLLEIKQAIADFELVDGVGGLSYAKRVVKQSPFQRDKHIVDWKKAIQRIEQGLKDE
ncbi:hypothetical protein [Acinetobacter ursingii]|uniref:hypothetical protein n=1 Tax=Acinetobacter ursingii TaxID=108980 RepID=UPI0032B6162F